MAVVACSDCLHCPEELRLLKNLHETGEGSIQEILCLLCPTLKGPDSINVYHLFFLPFFSLRVLSSRTIELPRDQSIWDGASLLLDCLRRPFDPDLDEVAWHCCDNAAVSLLIMALVIVIEQKLQQKVAVT